MYCLTKWQPSALVMSMAFVVVALSGCSEDEKQGPRNELAKYDSEVVTSWFELAMNITKTERLTPPVAARAYAYQGITLYEAVVAGLETHQSLAGQLHGLAEVPQANPASSYHWPTVANAALATVARHVAGEPSGHR
jgi:hypothetical protein